MTDTNQQLPSLVVNYYGLSLRLVFTYSALYLVQTNRFDLIDKLGIISNANCWFNIIITIDMVNKGVTASKTCKTIVRSCIKSSSIRKAGIVIRMVVVIAVVSV